MANGFIGLIGGLKDNEEEEGNVDDNDEIVLLCELISVFISLFLFLSSFTSGKSNETRRLAELLSLPILLVLLLLLFIFRDVRNADGGVMLD